MANYSFTQKAIDDLSEIWEYSFETWSESQADKYYELLIDTCRKIAENKIVGRNYIDVSRQIFGVHIAKHIVFYRQIEIGRIEVVRILHERMDVQSQLPN